MELSEIITLSAILVTLFLAVVALLWQMRALDSRINAQGAELREEIRRQNGELRADMRDQNGVLRAEMRDQNGNLRTEIRAQNGSLDEVRLQQARQEGINSVLAQDRHTHPPVASADD